MDVDCEWGPQHAVSYSLSYDIVLYHCSVAPILQDITDTIVFITYLDIRLHQTPNFALTGQLWLTWILNFISLFVATR